MSALNELLKAVKDIEEICEDLTRQQISILTLQFDLKSDATEHKKTLQKLTEDIENQTIKYVSIKEKIYKYINIELDKSKSKRFNQYFMYIFIFIFVILCIFLFITYNNYHNNDNFTRSSNSFFVSPTDYYATKKIIPETEIVEQTIYDATYNDKSYIELFELTKKAAGFFEFDHPFNPENIIYCFIDPICKNCEETKKFFQERQELFIEHKANIYWIPVSILSNNQAKSADMLNKNITFEERIKLIDINTAILLHYNIPPAVPYIVWDGSNGPGTLLGTPDDESFAIALDDMTGGGNA